MQGDGEKRKASPQMDTKSRGAATATRTHDGQSKNGNRYKVEDSMGENRPKTKIKIVAVAKQSLYPGPDWALWLHLQFYKLTYIPSAEI